MLAAGLLKEQREDLRIARLRNAEFPPNTPRNEIEAREFKEQDEAYDRGLLKRLSIPDSD